jgi:hypothetical protein
MMMNSRLVRILMILAITSLVAACKLAVIVVEGGEVQSSHSGTCLDGTICVHQVNDTNYTETFTAVPYSGWVFEKWNSGSGFFCGKSTNPACTLSLEGTAGNADFEALVASDKTFYIMPVFVVAPPITDVVEFDGSVWAQADLFTNLSWTEINAVCPGPEGLCNGYLNGYDVNGWVWASIDDVFDLLVSLGHPPLTYPPTWQYGESSSDWAPAFYDAGFRQTFESAGRAFVAWASSSDEACLSFPPTCGVTASVVDRVDATAADFVELLPIHILASSPGRGAWLYKTASSAHNLPE